MNEQAFAGIVEEIVRCVLAAGPAQAGCEPESDVIPVELSARHAHLSEEHALALFGGPLTSRRELSQPGEFLCEERVRLIGPSGVLDNVAVLGPARGRSQVEISKTDARYLGVEVPVRASGDLEGSPGIILASQRGIVGLESGLIVAMRHIHMNPEDAGRYCVRDGDLVSVRLEGERPVILEKVLVRVRGNFRLAMHIDADEGNSAGCGKGASGRIMVRADGAARRQSRGTGA